MDHVANQADDNAASEWLVEAMSSPVAVDAQTMAQRVRPRSYGEVTERFRADCDEFRSLWSHLGELNPERQMLIYGAYGLPPEMTNDMLFAVFPYRSLIDLIDTMREAVRLEQRS